MALINNVENSGSITYGGDVIQSNIVNTILLLPPIIAKTVDKLIASIGETLTYTLVITNLALNPITNLPFADSIPAGTEYIAGSFTLNGSTVTPTITDDVLNYTIPNLGALGIATITFQVEIVGGEI